MIDTLTIIGATCAGAFTASLSFRFMLVRASREARQFRVALRYIACRHAGVRAHILADQVLNGRPDLIDVTFPDYLAFCADTVTEDELRDMA